MLDCCIREKIKWDLRYTLANRDDQEDEFFDAEENLESEPGL